MSDRPSGPEAVERGPSASDVEVLPAAPGGNRESRHPSVLALLSRFGDAVLRHELAAGDQSVVWLDPARNVEILTFLKNDPEHGYDLLVDVTLRWTTGGDGP